MPGVSRRRGVGGVGRPVRQAIWASPAARAGVLQDFAALRSRIRDNRCAVSFRFLTRQWCGARASWEFRASSGRTNYFCPCGCARGAILASPPLCGGRSAPGLRCAAVANTRQPLRGFLPLPDASVVWRASLVGVQGEFGSDELSLSLRVRKRSYFGVAPALRGPECSRTSLRCGREYATTAARFPSAS